MLKSSISLLLIGALAYGGYIGFTQLDSSIKASTPDQHQPDEVDYQIKQFEAVIFNRQGQAIQTLQGKELKHYPFDNHYRIAQPIGKTLNSEERWTIQANTATTRDGLNEVHWQNQVVLKQTGKNTVTLNSEDLIQNARQQTASTNKGVTITSTLGDMKAEQMQLNSEDNKLQLKGRVRGTYEAP